MVLAGHENPALGVDTRPHAELVTLAGLEKAVHLAFFGLDWIQCSPVTGSSSPPRAREPAHAPSAVKAPEVVTELEKLPHGFEFLVTDRYLPPTSNARAQFLRS